MQQGLSTHIFLPRRLSPGLLDTLVAAGASTIEVFAARHHFDYTDVGAVREIANWFRSADGVTATMHMPLYSDAAWSRHTAPTLNLISASKASRIEAMDEVKRAIEAAEQAPFVSCVLHLGMKDDKWDSRSLDDSMTAIEHLKAFAGPLGIKLLLENLPNEVATPANLVEIVRVGHFANVGFCLDMGHANLAEAIPETSHEPAKPGIEQAFEAFGDRLVEMHLHDNHGSRDEHLWPGDGAIDWKMVATKIAELKAQPLGVMEIAHELGEDAGKIAEKARAAFETVEQTQGRSD
jgi:sugar phosphate isomerase/epimerase